MSNVNFCEPDCIYARGFTCMKQVKKVEGDICLEYVSSFEDLDEEEMQVRTKMPKLTNWGD